MSDNPVSMFTTGPPETILPDVPGDVAGVLADALSSDDPRGAVSAVVADHPTLQLGWARLGQLARDPVEAYAAYRVGYHRGLDALRQNGWRGSGFVRWRHESNRGFLLALDGLRAMAEAIGETDEAERCALFLRQLDPEWPPDDLG